MKEILITLFTRDLQRLKNEMAAYNDEACIWKVEPHIANSAGNLCLHLIGNLNTYIGAAIANTKYQRQRELEFTLKNIPCVQMLQQIDDTDKMVQQALQGLTTAQLQSDFPVIIWDKPFSMQYTLLHLCTHLNYHLGQINYHRRLLDN